MIATDGHNVLPPLLSLPAELRNAIYAFVAADDLHRFAATFGRPPLLRVCQQTRDEYAGVFFGDANLTINAYYHETACWCTVSGTTAKMAIIDKCLFTHLVRVSGEGDALHSTAGPRWWQWTIDA